MWTLEHRNGHYISNNNQHQQQNQQEVTATSQKLYPVETLDTYLERIASTPRSLKSITRRHILSDLTKSNQHNSVHVTRSCPELHAKDAAIKRAGSTSAAVKIMQLDMPTKLKEYLLFVEWIDFIVVNVIFVTCIITRVIFNESLFFSLFYYYSYHITRKKKQTNKLTQKLKIKLIVF